MVLVAGVLLVVDLSRVSRGDGAPAGSGTVATGTPSASAGGEGPLTSPTPAPVVVHKGLGTFVTAPGDGPVAGRGRLHRYRVAVENGIDMTAADFAADVDAILDDPRGWTAGGTVRFQRVAAGRAAEFTVYLASPVTADAICREGGLDIAEYTNCRLSPGKVVINSARWLTAVPDYGAPLDVYRGYAVNHEVGHQLGYGHELCPGPGLPAPVMQQQTLGLHGCVANAWLYPDGEPYHGLPAPV